MLETEIKQALTRYIFLLELLNHIIEKTDSALSNDNRWFAFAPKIGRKFLNQAVTLHLLFSEKQLEIDGQPPKRFEDISALYTLLRMQLETHALFYHLFIPGISIEENILRFRLWELDGIRTRIRLNIEKSQKQLTKKLADQEYLQTIEQAISGLPYYQKLAPNTQKFLTDKAIWRFTDSSLKNKPLKAISYDQLIRQAGIREDLYSHLYSYLSTHTHPGYHGVVQNFSATQDELTTARYVAIMTSCYVTSFMIEDFCRRFGLARKILDNLTEADREVYESIRSAGRTT